MKSFIAILLASAFLLQSAGKLFVMANYQINKDFISKNLCVNKAKPIMKCNGKCHLKKQLEKEDKKENSPASSLKEKVDIQIIHEIKPLIAFTDHNNQFKLNSEYLLSNYSKHLKFVFHPPRA